MDQHTGGSRLTPTVHRCSKGMAVGGSSPQHKAQHTVQKHGKHGSGALAARALLKRVCCVMGDPGTSVKCRILRRISTEVRNAKTLTVVVRERCLARRRYPTQPTDVEKSVLANVMTNQFCTDRGKERCPGVIITCTQIQVAGKVIERSSHKARLTELNTSDETFPRDDHHLHFDSDC